MVETTAVFFPAEANFLISEGRASELEQLTADEMLAANLEWLDYMLAARTVSESNLETRMRRFVAPDASGPVSICTQRECPAGTDFLSIDMNGWLFPCDRFWDNEDNRLCNIFDADPPADAIRERLKRIHEIDYRELGCFGCEAKFICLHGCTATWKSIEERERQCSVEIALARHMEQRRGEIEAFIDLRDAVRRLDQARAAEGTT